MWIARYMSCTCGMHWTDISNPRLHGCIRSRNHCTACHDTWLPWPSLNVSNICARVTLLLVYSRQNNLHSHLASTSLCHPTSCQQIMDFPSIDHRLTTADSELFTSLAVLEMLWPTYPVLIIWLLAKSLRSSPLPPYSIFNMSTKSTKPCSISQAETCAF